jgi:hypothetical protein
MIAVSVAGPIQRRAPSMVRGTAGPAIARRHPIAIGPTTYGVANCSFELTSS